jgi:hypothetical protein
MSVITPGGSPLYGSAHAERTRPMTQADFNHLLASVNALSPEQMRQLRQQLDSALAHAVPPAGAQPKAPPARTPGKAPKRTKATAAPKEPMTKEEFHRHLLAIGKISQLPDTDADYDEPDDEPITIKGEPLSETVIRERR